MGTLNKPFKVATYYMAIDIAWYLLCLSMENALTFYSLIFFFIFHYPGLLLARLFYVHQIGEPWWQSHLVTGFLITINTFIVFIVFFTINFVRNKMSNQRLHTDGHKTLSASRHVPAGEP